MDTKYPQDTQVMDTMDTQVNLPRLAVMLQSPPPPTLKLCNSDISMIHCAFDSPAALKQPCPAGQGTGDLYPDHHIESPG
jgi:hypothetical protein